MKRIVVLVGLLGVAVFGMRRLFLSDDGTIEGSAAQAADALRKQGPRFVDSVAGGIEKAGSATEKGASTLRDAGEKGASSIRDATEKGTSTIRKMTSGEEENGAQTDDEVMEPRAE